MRFEWDTKKNRDNIRNHDLSFEKAVGVFSDPYKAEVYDKIHSDDEYRYKVIGFVDNLLTVVVTERGDVTRLISAWKASPDERKFYYGYNSSI
jgi:uncharacterized DUF497 family protein